jgi:hypothetical protein
MVKGLAVGQVVYTITIKFNNEVFASLYTRVGVPRRMEIFPSVSESTSKSLICFTGPILFDS